MTTAEDVFEYNVKEHCGFCGTKMKLRHTILNTIANLTGEYKTLKLCGTCLELYLSHDTYGKAAMDMLIEQSPGCNEKHDVIAMLADPDEKRRIKRNIVVGEL